jgi:YegS/Rv2252/BmrU family lipid kinase
MAEAGVDTIVAVGGDGTVNEIINGMIRDDAAISPRTRLALVPSGTGKDLSRSLGTREVEYTLRALELDAVTHIDIGRIEFHDAETGAPVSRYFVNVADLGLGADVASRINRSSKALGGLMSYMINSIKTIVVFNAQEVRVTVDDTLAYDGRAHLVIFANGRYFAGGMHIAPDSSLRDGLLDIFILEDVSKRELLTSLLPSVYRGKHIGKRGVHHLKGAHATVKCGSTMLVEMDGEQPGHGPITVRTIPRVLPIVAAGAVLR